MPFTDFAIHVTDENAVIHEFFSVETEQVGEFHSPGRLGLINGVDVDQPRLGLPLVGTGSLHMQFLTTNLVGHIYRADEGHRGYLSGYLQTRWFAAQATELPPCAFGIYCYASQESLVTSGACYFFGCASLLPGLAHPQSVFLARSADGLAGFPNTMTLLDVADNAWVVSEPFVTKLLWTVMPTALILDGYVGGTEEDLTLRLSSTDLAPLVTTVGEGLWAAQTTGTTLKVYADETAFFEGLG